jgi:hypothetical protein
VPEGLRVTIRRSNTDQEGRGAVIAVQRGAVACPVAAFKARVRAAGITAGPVFRPIAKGERLHSTWLTDRSVAKIVKAHAARAGLDAADFSALPPPYVIDITRIVTSAPEKPLSVSMSGLLPEERNHAFRGGWFVRVQRLGRFRSGKGDTVCSVSSEELCRGTVLRMSNLGSAPGYEPIAGRRM